jgi:hypothetical protein
VGLHNFVHKAEQSSFLPETSRIEAKDFLKSLQKQTRTVQAHKEEDKAGEKEGEEQEVAYLDYQHLSI